MMHLPPGVEHLIMFDGYCNLCNSWVNFLLRADRRKRLYFASLQSPVAATLLQSIAGLDLHESLVLVERDQLTTRSTAVLRALWLLGGIWRVTGVFRLIPRRVRDPLYDFVAKRRYRWFGRRGQCRVPNESDRDRILA
ncbi:MAG: DUF393 domain-containing protein [candidate division Zixibacteria bacterium]|nr:DUF393 domain-containing protein [candidate division Zixibacteria bacterium]